MKFLVLAFLMLIAALGAACTNKPAYSNVNVNRARAEAAPEASSNAEAATPGQQPATEGTTPGGEATANAAPPPAGGPPPVQEVKPPSFLDSVKGEAKDLPGYPNALRRTFTVGPMEGHDAMSMTLESGDPIEKIAAFYDKAIKANKWTVLDNTRDQEVTEWVLKKGNTSDGKVQIKKNPSSNSYFIVIARTERPATSKDAAKAK